MIAEIMKKMIEDSRGSLHDIDHLIRVWSYARTIGLLEGLDAETQETLEAAAIVHDIACPSLREKCGACPGRMQEEAGMPMARELLSGMGMKEKQLDRAVYLVGHHHTPGEVDGPDYQILLEADYIANAGESGYAPEAIRAAQDSLFRTRSGKELLRSIFRP